MTERVQRGELAIAKELYDFIVNQAIEGTGVSVDDYWTAFEAGSCRFNAKKPSIIGET
jgi:malate synthase